MGTATVDGSATATFTDDPEIVITNPVVTPPTPPSGGGGGGGGGGYTDPTPTAAELAATAKAAADAATKLAADQLAATQKAAATAIATATAKAATTAKAAATKLAAAQAAAPKTINKPITSIATSIAPMLLPTNVQNAIVTLTAALIKLGTSTKAKTVILPTSQLIVSKVLVRTPGICSVSGNTVTSTSLGTCVLTYTMTTSTGKTVRTMKKITFKV